MRAVNARAVRIWVLSIGLVVSVVAGNSALKHGVDSAQNQAILALVLNPWVIAGIVLLMAWMLLRMALLSIMPMSIILPLTAGISYVLTGLTGRFLLGETVGARQLWGLVLICIGVLFMGKSSAQDPDTHK